AVRADAGAFDVSHMGQLHVEGPMASEFLQAMLSNDLDRLSNGEAQYTLLTNERGGIVDDLIVYRMSHGHYLLVVNAGNREAAYGWLEEREARGTEVRDASDEYALVAVQGPRSLERLGLDDAPAFTHAMGEVDGVEVCYPLHGNDITQDTDAIAAGLAWTCALNTDFTGADVLRRIKEEGPQRRLAAFVMEERAIPRPEMPIEGGGEVTSGTQSPSLDVGIGMGYVPAARAAPDTELVIDVRGKPRRARVVKKPIYRRES